MFPSRITLIIITIAFALGFFLYAFYPTPQKYESSIPIPNKEIMEDGVIQ